MPVKMTSIQQKPQLGVNRHQQGHAARAMWWALICGSGVLQLAAQDTTPPTVPQNIQALELSETTASVTWNPATDDVAVTSYQVFRDHALLGTSASTNFTDAGPLDKYRSYEYTVSASDAAGNTSPPSPAVVFAYRRFPFVMPWDGPS